MMSVPATAPAEGNICGSSTDRSIRYLKTSRDWASAPWPVNARLALAEFALGLEGLYRFVERQPLLLIHESVFGVLALESEPVDPPL